MKPNLELNQIHQGNCIQALAQMPAQCIDTVITDPPYPNRMNFFSDSILDGYAALYLCCNVARSYVIFFWNAFDAPLPPEGWHIVAKHIWHKPDHVSASAFEIITVWARTDKRLRSNVWSIPILEYKTLKDWKPLPTQKPVQLIKNILDQHTKSGDIILDPFMGTGTTAVACKQLKRNFIGYEINPRNLAIAEKRINHFARR